MKKAGKVVVIGLDGATFDVILPLAKKGCLPNLKRLIDNGAWGTLNSTTPSFTAPAWCSFFTGCNPGKHGVFDFVKNYGINYAHTAYTSRDLRVKTMFRLLSDAGRKVIALDIPMTYPPEEVNGVLVTGLMTPSDSCEFTHPKEVKQEITEKFGRFTFDVEIPNTETEDQRPMLELRKKIMEMVGQRFQIADHFMRTREWEFLMFVITGTDRVQHGFWKYYDETHPKHDPNAPKELKSAIEDIFRQVDTEIGRLLKNAGEETTVFIVSDHGHGPAYGDFRMNKWLAAHGYSKKKTQVVATRDSGWKPESQGGAKAITVDGGGFQLELNSPNSFAGERISLVLEDDAVYSINAEMESERQGILFEFCDVNNSNRPILYDFIATAGAQACNIKFIPKVKAMELSMRISSYGSFPVGKIKIRNISITKMGNYRDIAAYGFAGRQGIKINLEGKGPYGTVRQQDYARMRDKIWEGLRAEKDAATGKPLFKSVLKGDEVYWGSAAGDGPDIIFDDYADYSPGISNPFFGPVVSTQSGNHRQNGIFIAAGNGVKKAELDSLMIWDVAPTILYALGVKVPRDMDGKPAFGAFTEKFRSEKSPEYTDSSTVEAKPAKEFDDSELALVDSRLRALGYLE